MTRKRKDKEEKPDPAKKADQGKRAAQKKAANNQGVSVRQILAKAAVMTGREVDESSALAAMQQTVAQYDDEGAVEPPYDPESLLNYVELTPHLSPNIAAYQQNIEGYGYQAILAEPWMEDFDAEDTFEAVKNALQFERWADEEEAAFGPQDEPTDNQGDPEVEEPESGDPVDDEGEGEVTDDEVNEKLEEVKVQIRRDQFLFDAFFKHCCSTMSFTKLRRITRGDIEANGWGSWEMLMDGFDRLKRLNYIPGYTVRPLKDEGMFVEVTEDDPVTPLSEGREIKVHRRFRRYVQIVGEKRTFYKTPGDPRVVSRTTGKVYDSIEDMQKPEEDDDGGEGKDAKEANQLLYIPLHDPRTPCPCPRWIGNLLAVLGVREADESNYFYLNSNAIPPGILFVAGGKVPRGMKDILEQRMTQELGGAENSHKILVVEAHPMKLKGEERTLLPSMQFESLRDAQQNDATFTEYDERSADRIGASFRLSPILRGYTPKNLNRATAIAALAFAEQQVFEPERDEIDWIINKYILPMIGVKYLRFRSNSPPTRSPEEIAELIKVAAPHGGLLPYEIRSLVGDALNRAIARIDEEWVKQPMPMTLAGLGDVAPAGDGDAAETVASLANKLDQMQKRVEAIITEELRAAGFEGDVRATFMDPDNEDDEDDDG